MARAVRRLILLIISLVAGCRGLPQRPLLPVAHEVPAEQLVFHTDFELVPDHRLVRELKEKRDDICAILELPPSAERIDVYLFRDAEAYGRYLVERFPNVPPRRAFFVESDTNLTVYAHWSDRVAEDLRHEVAHGYLHAMVRGLPLWLDEGLAEYFEVPRTQSGLNGPHLELLADMSEHNGWKPNLVRLEGLTDAAQMEQRDYAEAWAWVYFLLSEPNHRQLLIDYLADLRTTGSTATLPDRLRTLDDSPDHALMKFLKTRGGPAAGGKGVVQWPGI
jgi:hypothetical protein